MYKAELSWQALWRAEDESSLLKKKERERLLTSDGRRLSGATRDCTAWRNLAATYARFYQPLQACPRISQVGHPAAGARKKLVSR